MKWFSKYFVIGKAGRALPLHIDDYDDQDKPLMDGEENNDSTTQGKAQKRAGPDSHLLILSWPLLVVLIFASIIVGATIAGIASHAASQSKKQQPATEHHHHHDESLAHPSSSTSSLSSSASSSEVMVSPCGSTPDEARSRGCHFDVISFCWLPDACYDAELTSDFDNKYALEWFLDASRTQPVSHDQVMTGEYTGLFVNWEYHITHCTAMWKKMHRAVMYNRPLDGYIGSYAHTNHCEHMLLSGRNVELSVINTRIRVKYPDCGIEIEGSKV